MHPCRICTFDGGASEPHGSLDVIQWESLDQSRALCLQTALLVDGMDCLLFFNSFFPLYSRFTHIPFSIVLICHHALPTAVECVD